MGNGTHGQRGIMVNTEDRDGAPWEMGHMGNGTHGQRGKWLILKLEMGHLGGWGTWAIGLMGITSLILEGSSPKLYST